MIPTSDTATVGYIGRIPVRNIWLLLLYASQLYRELSEARRVQLEDATDDIPDLVAELLANAVERRLRRSLTFGHQRREADLNRLRGRIDLLRTERRQLLQRGRVACIFDELTIDTPRNRYVKAALLRFGQVVKGSDLARRCRDLAARLERAGVTGIPDARRQGSNLPPDGPGWMSAEERQMLAAARLAFDLSIPTEEAGRTLLAIPDQRAKSGWKLYEAAVAGFYKAVLSERGWRVKTQSGINWPLENPTPSLREIMPGMITDIVLERRNRSNPAAGRRIVIDTKFTSIVTDGAYREHSLKSDNIYQIYAYLRSQENGSDPLSVNTAGVLLYPAIDTCIDEAAVIQGHEVRFTTVNLAADGQTIRRQLLRVVCSSPLNGVG